MVGCIILLLLFCLIFMRIEISSQDCLSQENCNTSGYLYKNLNKELPFPEITRLNSVTVHWRRCLLIAIFSTILIYIYSKLFTDIFDQQPGSLNIGCLTLVLIIFVVCYSIEFFLIEGQKFKYQKIEELLVAHF